MHKLETLSRKVLTQHQEIRTEWENAVGPFRREIFVELYNANNVVRCFATEIPESPLTLPKLDDYALGLKQGQYWYHQSASAKRDPLSLLTKVRTVILLTDNNSMRFSGHVSSRSSRPDSSPGWSQARQLLAEVAPKVSEYNRHGIDIHFLNRPTFYAGIHTASEIGEVFDSVIPRSGTYTLTGHKISDILDGYMSTLRYYRDLMPLNLLVITAGRTDDEATLIVGIEDHLSQVIEQGFPAHQLGIEFVQVGTAGREARQLKTILNEVARHRENFKCDFVGLTRIRDINADSLLRISLSGFDARLNGHIRDSAMNYDTFLQSEYVY